MAFVIGAQQTFAAAKEENDTLPSPCPSADTAPHVGDSWTRSSCRLLIQQTKSSEICRLFHLAGGYVVPLRRAFLGRLEHSMAASCQVSPQQLPRPDIWPFSNQFMYAAIHLYQMPAHSSKDVGGLALVAAAQMNGQVAGAHALCRNKWSRCQAKKSSAAGKMSKEEKRKGIKRK